MAESRSKKPSRAKAAEAKPEAPAEKPPPSKVKTGFDYPFKKTDRPQVSVGVTSVRRDDITTGPKQRAVGAYEAAEACELFGGRAGKGGGGAFVRWCADQGIVGARPASEWRALLEAFAARPIHGHRRTAAGGNHRQNR